MLHTDTALCGEPHNSQVSGVQELILWVINNADILPRQNHYQNYQCHTQQFDYVELSLSICSNRIATVILLLMAHCCLILKLLNESHLIYYNLPERDQDKRKPTPSIAPLVLRGVQIIMCLEMRSSLHICLAPSPSHLQGEEKMSNTLTLSVCKN